MLVCAKKEFKIKFKVILVFCFAIKLSLNIDFKLNYLG